MLLLHDQMCVSAQNFTLQLQQVMTDKPDVMKDLAKDNIKALYAKKDSIPVYQAGTPGGQASAKKQDSKKTDEKKKENDEDKKRKEEQQNAQSYQDDQDDPDDSQMLDQNQEGYKYGSFSKFAVRKQQVISKKEAIIEDVIKQAMLSHLQRIKQQSAAQQKLQKRSKQIEGEIKAIVGEKKNIYRLIKQPAKQWARIFIQAELASTVQIKQYFQKFIQTIFLIKNLRIIDGKIIDETQWKLASLKQGISNNILLQSKQNERIYVSLGSAKIGTTLYEWAGSLHTKQQLLKFDPEQRKIMTSMIIAYLKQKKIITNDDQIGQSINKILQKASSQS